MAEPPVSASKQELLSTRTLPSSLLDHLYPKTEEFQWLLPAFFQSLAFWTPAPLARGETSLRISSAHPALTSWLAPRLFLTSHTETIYWSILRDFWLLLFAHSSFTGPKERWWWIILSDLFTVKLRWADDSSDLFWGFTIVCSIQHQAHPHFRRLPSTWAYWSSNYLSLRSRVLPFARIINRH